MNSRRPHRGSCRGCSREWCPGWHIQYGDVLTWGLDMARGPSDAFLGSFVSMLFPDWWNKEFSDIPGFEGVTTLQNEWQRSPNASSRSQIVKHKRHFHTRVVASLCGFLILLITLISLFLPLAMFWMMVFPAFIVAMASFGGIVTGFIGISFVLTPILCLYYYVLHSVLWEKLPNTTYVWIELVRGETSKAALPNPISDLVKSFFYFVLKDKHFERLDRFDNYLSVVQYKLTTWRKDAFHHKFFGFLVLCFTIDLFIRALIAGLKSLRILLACFWSCSVAMFWFSAQPLNTFCIAYWIVRTLIVSYRVFLGCSRVIYRLLVGFTSLVTRRQRRSVGAMEDNVVWVDVTFIEHVRICLKIFRINVLVQLLMFLKRIGFLVVAYGMPASEYRLRAILTNGAMALTHYINELDPPQFIRNFRFTSDIEDVKETLDILKELGYPIDPDVELTEPDMFPGTEKFKEWILSGSSFVTGLAPLRVFTGLEFRKVQELAVPYKWSDSYVSIQNELESTSRYFQRPEVDIPNFELALDATWDMVKDIFKGSRITPFYVIYKNWKKNYNVGPFATSIKRPRNKKGLHVKMKRREDVARFGSIKGYLGYWETLYRNFPRLASFANVFYKSEALPPKKWSIGRIRTVVSSFLPQYLWQMVFSYQPNHNLKPLTTPIKVGLPLTGFWLTQLFERHLNFKYHYAGDMSNFDSSINGKVMQAVKAVRARGFENHRAFKIIAQMIDLNYSAIENILLVTGSTGNVYKKGTGLTTGHASTSMDNSVTTVFLYMTAWVTLTGRSAEDFKYFNELSCYGDDHLLSIHEMAPKDWTFHNIQKLMKQWGIDMRDEVEYITKVDLKTGGKVPVAKRRETDLYSLPFLSKYCRKPTQQDVQDWRDAFGSKPLPKVIVYHDPIGLLGKAAAGSKNRNVDYRMTRLHSYLQMSAFNRDTYEAVRSMMQILIRKYPSMPDRLKKIPSFIAVNQSFMNPNKKLANPDDESDEDGNILDIGDGSVVVYGQMTILDYLHNYLAVIPDVLNPSIQRVGYSLVTHRLVQPMLEWPKELLRDTNTTLTQGHFETVIMQTPYNFLINHQMPTITTNRLTLLVRHWLFLTLRSDTSGINFFGFIDKLLIKIANMQFIINGKVSSKTTQFSVPIWNTLLVLVLNFISLPDVHLEYDEDNFVSAGDIFYGVQLPDLALWANRLWGLVVARIWYSVPPNFREVHFLTKPLLPGSKHYVVAGTGTGKSTDFIQFLYQFAGTNWKKIIVVEPRSKVVTGLVEYMSGRGLPCSGATTGLILDSRAPVWYVTAQEVLLHLSWLEPGNLFVIDEAHLQEEAYDVLFRVLDKRNDLVKIYLSATPREGQQKEMTTFTEVPIPKVYSTVSVDYPDGVSKVSLDRKKSNFWLTTYFNHVNNIMMFTNVAAKYLIFVNDKSDIDFMLSNLKGVGLGLSSTLTPDFNQPFDFVVTTSVADVAITIPGITHVITPNFKRSLEPISQTKLAPTFIRLDEGTINQRKGRTGRTNNGYFFLVKMEFEEKHGIVDVTEKSHPLQVASWVLQGLPLEVLKDAKPEVFDFRGPKTASGPSKKMLDELEASLVSEGLIRSREDDAEPEKISIPLNIKLKGVVTPSSTTGANRVGARKTPTPASYGFEMELTHQLNKIATLVAAKYPMMGGARASSNLWVDPISLKENIPQ